jgi:hypothetical protein
VDGSVVAAIDVGNVESTDCDRIGAATGQRVEWVVPAGSVD